MEESLELYVNKSVSAPDDAARTYPTAADALEAADRLAPMSAGVRSQLADGKQYPAADYDVTPVTIHIAPGTYRERLVIARPKVTFLGENAETTVLVYGLGAAEILENGEKRGTFRTASVRIDAPDFTAKRLTFQNDAGYGHTVGQALALYVDADRCAFEECRLIGSQDTLFTAPLPFKEAQLGGFRGPGEFQPRVHSRQCYRHCFIQGDVDFIFGSATAWFEDCEIYSKMPGDRLPPESPADAQIYGYVTAASTYENTPYGYVFSHCRLTSDCPAGTIYLGRPWREYAKTVFIGCELGAHIHPAGWQDWNKDHSYFYYAEYRSHGPGASPGTRADFSHQLTDAQAAEYTIENVLNGWKPD